MALRLHLSIGSIAHPYNGIKVEIPLGILDRLIDQEITIESGPLCIEYTPPGITAQFGGGCVAERLSGVQGGVVCYAEKEMNGLQAGWWFCYAGDGDLYQFAPLTIRGKGAWYTRITPFFGWLRKEHNSDTDPLPKEPF